jgi:site-specific recombinase XerD
MKLTPKAPLFVDRRGDRLKRGGAHYLVERSYGAAGLANRVPAGAMVHALRHTFATRLAGGGATATEIQALLGHESLNTSQDRCFCAGKLRGGRHVRASYRPAPQR